MYVELTPEDTLRDLQTLLIDALPGFEFPRCNLTDYTIETAIKPRSEVVDGDFVLGIIWHELEGDSLDDMLAAEAQEEMVLVENSTFNFELTTEEINIIALLMMQAWVQRQVTSIENTRMKYSGSDFKMTSQANHLQKLMSLLNECKIIRLTNQVWKLIPMRENEEDWQKQLDTVILEIAGLNEIFLEDPLFLQLLAKLEGIRAVESVSDFSLYRKTVFEAIGLLRGLIK